MKARLEQRLSRTFLTQVDALKKYRDKAQQVVRVERVDRRLRDALHAQSALVFLAGIPLFAAGGSAGCTAQAEVTRQARRRFRSGSLVAGARRL